MQHLAVVPLEAQLLLKALTEEVSEALAKRKKISVWVDSRRYKGGYLRASQVRSTTPSTSAWQQRGVSSAGQTEPGARSWIMAGMAAAMAAKARMVNCILAFEGFW